MRLSPIIGWSDFSQCVDVLRLINSTLGLAEDGGIWDFYHFTKNSSVWCSSEIRGTNQLKIIFDQDTDIYKIKLLSFEFTNNGGTHFKQLFKLRSQLIKQFDIRTDLD